MTRWYCKDCIPIGYSGATSIDTAMMHVKNYHPDRIRDDADLGPLVDPGDIMPVEYWWCKICKGSGPMFEEIADVARHTLEAHRSIQTDMYGPYAVRTDEMVMEVRA